ncbi:MAG: HipA domain-containing protein, partial [Deltaproteobacteria bacterium]|nr:HipA domain-containing protein [Deltaproteobacteria bacterium]
GRRVRNGIAASPSGPVTAPSVVGSPGAPGSSTRALSALSRIASAPLVCARDLLRQVAFAFLTCNGDAHAKNFSIRQAPDGEWEATPAYDLPSSYPYGDQTMALRVHGKDREDIGKADFLALGASLGLPARAVLRVLEQLADAAPRWMEHLDDLPFGARRVHKLRRAISFRRDRLAASRPDSVPARGVRGPGRTTR